MTIERPKSNNRKRWMNEDLILLIKLWAEFGSVMIISKIMDRPPSSIQTQASRRNLPKREIGSGRHRKKWNASDDKALGELIPHGVADGSVDMASISKKCDRSIDAIFNRLVEHHSWDESVLLKKLKMPDTSDILMDLSSQSGQVKPAFKRINGKGTRTCPRCFRPFHSEGRWHQICSACKRTDDWKSGL